MDSDPSAVSEAAGRFGAFAEAVVEGDLTELPFEDESFDAIVCFATISHIEDRRRALAELRRVLREDGLLLISSPNPDAHPAANERHVREYRLGELAAALGEHFSQVSSYRQHAWLASAIEPADEPPPGGDAEARFGGSPWLTRAATLEPGEESYGIVVAGNGDTPEPRGAVLLGDSFEVAWRSDQADEQIREAERRAQRAVAQARQRETDAVRRQQRAAASLLDANQQLSPRRSQ